MKRVEPASTEGGTKRHWFDCTILERGKRIRHLQGRMTMSHFCCCRCDSSSPFPSEQFDSPIENSTILNPSLFKALKNSIYIMQYDWYNNVPWQQWQRSGSPRRKKIIGLQIKNDAIIGPHDFLFIMLYFERVDDGQTDRSQEREHVASRYITRFTFC